MSPREPEGLSTWSNPSSYREDWDFRAEAAAKWAFPEARVVDLGCGPKKSLQRFLPEGCVYTAVDLTRWSDDVFQADFDAGQFPPGKFDCSFILGVIEYLNSPLKLLDWTRSSSVRLVMSYCHPVAADNALRSKRGWINGFSELELGEISKSQGWRKVESISLGENSNIHQKLYIFE